MGIQVCSGAMMQCSFGLAPSTLNVLPKNRVNACKMPAATIMDNIPFVNIPPFGMCTSLANPAVSAATAAALGVLTPMPCTPMIPAPWVVGGPTILIGKIPTLDNAAKLMCAYAGVIQIALPGQFTVMTK